MSLNNRAGLLRHWGRLETRTSAESGTKDASVSYATIADIRCNVDNTTGSQFVGKRGGDQSRTPTHVIEFRRVPDLSKANYIFMLNGPFKDIRFKLDDSSISNLGRRIFIGAYPIGDPSEFQQPVTPNLPDIFS